MSYAHETCCAHLKIQYCRESLEGLTHDWWECESCKMLFAPQGRASLSQWIPTSERLPTREDADERRIVREQASQIKRLTTLLNRTHIVLGLLTDDMHDEDIPPQVHALIADVRRIVREEIAKERGK